MLKEIDLTMAYIKELVGALRKEGRRITSYHAMYLGQNKSLLATFKQIAVKCDFKQFDDFEMLIQKQTAPYLQSTIIKYDAMRRDLDRAEKEKAKTNNQKGVETEVERKRQMDQQFIKRLSAEKILLANYLMDIAAKEIQRWTKIFQIKVEQEKIQQEIDALFTKK